jgi:hypothetical protein
MSHLSFFGGQQFQVLQFSAECVVGGQFEEIVLKAKRPQHVEPGANGDAGFALLDVVKRGAVDARSLRYLHGSEPPAFAGQFDLLPDLAENLLMPGEEYLRSGFHNR